MSAPSAPVILASASRARARILSAAGVAFERCDPEVDEALIKERLRTRGADAAELAAALAEAKAQAVAKRCPGALVIGADQVLEVKGTWFDKPRDAAEAETHLKRLRGRTHRLVSAGCVVRDGDRLWRHVETARLTMRSFSDEFLAMYLESAGAEVLESVGAYRLEGLGGQLFNRIDGSYFTILGLPLLPLLSCLRQRGVLPE